MLDLFREHPGRLYVVAAMLPLLPAALILVAGAVKNLARPAAPAGGFAARVYRRLGGERPQAWGAYLCVACLTMVAVLGFTGLIPFVTWDATNAQEKAAAEFNALGVPGGGVYKYLPRPPEYSEQAEWVRIGPDLEDGPGVAIRIGYHVDTLAALLFGMATVVGTLVAVFSLGYMADERQPHFHDHEAAAERRGRVGLFFAYLSLFIAAMLNLLIADNLFQVFVCWELVGACSFLLVGFYHERPAAGSAAVKAFVVNRIGDAGFLMAIAAAWSVAGTLTIANLPGGDARDELTRTYRLLLGLGLFLGCVGKSAQVPLQVWLPDAMAGPTPVSALIHAATMVAAGVYLAVRCRMLFTPEVYTLIAYTGCVTMLIGATTACVQTDIKRILAYSTVSQLGLMMLGVGVVGEYGPSSAVFHLITHACFKALLFLAAGSVIWATHHEQDLRKMGGLRRKMPLAAYTMLIGVLAISGFPFLSGWYSKEAIIGDAVFAVLVRPGHALLAIAPLVVAGLTAFYMFRLWFLVFAGGPRDPDVFRHAHEAPFVMTFPLLMLAALSIGVGWGWPVWETDASFLKHVLLDRLSIAHSLHWIGAVDDYDTAIRSAVSLSQKYHLLVEITAGAAAIVGFVTAYWMYQVRGLVPSEYRTAPAFLSRAWYFDAVYRTLLVRPMIHLTSALATADKRPGSADGTGSDPSATRFDFRTLDGWLNAVGLSAAAVGSRLRRLQAGFVRGYVLALGLTVVGLLGMLAALIR